MRVRSPVEKVLGITLHSILRTCGIRSWWKALLVPAWAPAATRTESWCLWTSLPMTTILILPCSVLDCGLDQRSFLVLNCFQRIMFIPSSVQRWQKTHHCELPGFRWLLSSGTRPAFPRFLGGQPTKTALTWEAPSLCPWRETSA